MSSSCLPPHRAGEETDSDFESDPPSPKSSEDEEAEEDEGLNSELEDVEPENLGQRPLLMDSEEDEEEEKHSSDSECEERKAPGRLLSEGESGDIPGVASPGTRAVDVFGAVPFTGATKVNKAPDCMDVFAKAPFRQASKDDPKDDVDVFTKAPFSRNLSKSSRDQVSPNALGSVDVFGFSPFQPSQPLPLTQSQEDVFVPVPSEEPQNPQKLKQRSHQKLSSRQRRTKQQEATGGNSKRHHSTPTGSRKSTKASYRTPERTRRHKKVGRRDSQSSNEFLSASKENISISMGEVKDKPPEDAILDPFGARPFHPSDGPRQCPHPGLPDNKSDARSRTGSLHSTYEGNIIDDFGALPFMETGVQGGPQQMPQMDLDPFGAAPFPSKQ